MPRVIQYDEHHQVKFVSHPQKDLEFTNRNNQHGFCKDNTMKEHFLKAYGLSHERFLSFNAEQFYQYIEEFEDRIACNRKDLEKNGIFYLQNKKLLAVQHPIRLQTIAMTHSPSRLKLVDYAKSMLSTPIFKALYQKALSNTLIVLTQQGYSSVIEVIQGLIDLGIHPENLIVFTKPATTEDANYDAIQRLATQYRFTYVTPDRRRHPALTEEQLKQLAIDTIIPLVDGKLGRPDIKNVIYYDEGGVLVNEQAFRDTCVNSWKTQKKISMSEHTTSGVNRYKNNLLDIVCFMFARSWIKLKCEPFFIAQSSYAQVKDKLLNLYEQRGSLVVGLIGCGNIGSEFARCLIEFARNKRVHILIHDARFRTHADFPTELSAFAIAYGVSVEFASAAQNSELVRRSDFIFGATGSDISGSLSQVSPQGQKKYLASISSGKREFEAIVDIHAPEHTNTQHIINGQAYELLNRGYPLNFKRTIDSVHPLQIQLIRASTILLIFQEMMYLQKLEILEKIPQEQREQARFLRFNAFFQYMLWNRFKAMQVEIPEHLRLPDRILNQVSSLDEMIRFSMGSDNQNYDRTVFEIDNSLLHDENFLIEYDKNHDLHFKEEKDKIVFLFRKHGLEVEDLDMLDEICANNDFDRHLFSLDTRAAQLSSMIQRFSSFNASTLNVSEQQFAASYHL